MNVLILIPVIYIIGIVLFCLWDAAVGFGVDFDGHEQPPLALVAAFWPAAIPILLINSYANFLSSLKEKRIKKEREASELAWQKKQKEEKLRIQLEREQEEYLKDVERELKSCHK